MVCQPIEGRGEGRQAGQHGNWWTKRGRPNPTKVIDEGYAEANGNLELVFIEGYVVAAEVLMEELPIEVSRSGRFSIGLSQGRNLCHAMLFQGPLGSHVCITPSGSEFFLLHTVVKCLCMQSMALCGTCDARFDLTW